MDPFAPWRDTIPLAAGIPRRKRAPLGEVFETAPAPQRRPGRVAPAVGAIAAQLFMRTRRLLVRTRGARAIPPIPATVEETR